MIKEHGTNEYVLQPSLLEVGEQYEKFAIISKMITKVDSLGKTYLQLVVRGTNGAPMIGRIFDSTVVGNILKNNSYIGKVVLLSFTTDIVYGQKSLTIDWMVVPEDEDAKFKGIKADLFSAVISNIDKYVSNLKNTFSNHKSIFTDIATSVFKQSAFSSLMYHSNEDICNGQCGYVYLILDTCWTRLEFYKNSGYITDNELSIMMVAQLLAECVIAQSDDCEFDYHYIVYTKLSKLMAGFGNTGTKDERDLLLRVLSCYADMRMGITESKTESKLAKIMYREYKSLRDNLCYLSTLSTYDGTVVNGRVIK